MYKLRALLQFTIHLKKKHVTTDSAVTIADGIAVKIPGDKTVELINKYADDVVTVSDAEISEAILLLLERTKQVVEPAGATPLAAVLNNKVDVKGKKIACVLSGGNIDVSFIHRIIELGLVTRERKLKFKTTLLDIREVWNIFHTFLPRQTQIS